MCVRIFNTDTKEETDSPIGFADMLGVTTTALPVDNAYGQLIPSSCLCQVDIKKACDMFGYNYNENEDFSVVVSKKTAEKEIQEILKYR